jgi:hypothetical protein
MDTIHGAPRTALATAPFLFCQCILLRNSTMKLIHPTPTVTMPIAMQRSDAVQIVPATIQTTLAPTLNLISKLNQ